MKNFKDQFRFCNPKDRLPLIPFQTAVRGTIMIEPCKCVVDGLYCGSVRCPKAETSSIYDKLKK